MKRSCWGTTPSQQKGAHASSGRDSIRDPGTAALARHEDPVGANVLDTVPADTAPRLAAVDERLSLPWGHPSPGGGSLRGASDITLPSRSRHASCRSRWSGLCRDGCHSLVACLMVRRGTGLLVACGGESKLWVQLH